MNTGFTNGRKVTKVVVLVLGILLVWTLVSRLLRPPICWSGERTERVRMYQIARLAGYVLDHTRGTMELEPDWNWDEVFRIDHDLATSFLLREYGIKVETSSRISRLGAVFALFGQKECVGLAMMDGTFVFIPKSDFATMEQFDETKIIEQWSGWRYPVSNTFTNDLKDAQGEPEIPQQGKKDGERTQ